MAFIITLINTIGQILTLTLLAYTVLSLFLPVNNPIRIFLARIIEPILTPIRKVVKPVSGLDFSPVVLLLIIYLVEWLLTRLLAPFVLR